MSFSIVPLLKQMAAPLPGSAVLSHSPRALPAPGRVGAVPLGSCFSPFGGCTCAARTLSLLSVGAVTPQGPWLWWAEPWLGVFLAGG